jgi:hypothetical protein
MEGAKNAMVATTSYFEPKARQWALSTEQNIDLPRVELADAFRIGGWCTEIGKNLNDYFAKGLSVPPALKDLTSPLAGKVVVAQSGYNCTKNFFAMVEADFPHETILRPLGSEKVSGDGTAGSEVASETARITLDAGSMPSRVERKARAFGPSASISSLGTERRSISIRTRNKNLRFRDAGDRPHLPWPEETREEIGAKGRRYGSLRQSHRNSCCFPKGSMPLFLLET